MSTETNQPTCRTCPYWDVSDPLINDQEGDDDLTVVEMIADKDRTIDGECRRYPRQANAKDGTAFGAHYWPRVSDHDWCGEHPDFPVWLASLAPRDPRA